MTYVQISVHGVQCWWGIPIIFLQSISLHRFVIVIYICTIGERSGCETGRLRLMRKSARSDRAGVNYAHYTQIITSRPQNTNEPTYFPPTKSFRVYINPLPYHISYSTNSKSILLYINRGQIFRVIIIYALLSRQVCYRQERFLKLNA